MAISKIPPTNVQKSSMDKDLERKTVSEVIFIKSGYEHLKIALADIFYIQSEADYTEIFTTEKKHLTSHSLRYWLQTLPEDQFAQVHKSYIVNIRQIMKVSGKRIFFDKATDVPIGRAFKEGFVEKYLK